jgi:hypothetical protein
MFQISLVAFCVGGAALSMAYYDVFFVVVALLLPLEEIVRSTVAARNAPSVERSEFGMGVPANA